jgi:hypothetical protein
MELWLTRQRNGMYMLTLNKPIIADVEGRGYQDAYVQPGDPIGMRNFCDLILKIVGLEGKLNRLESIRINLEGGIIL